MAGSIRIIKKKYLEDEKYILQLTGIYGIHTRPQRNKKVKIFTYTDKIDDVNVWVAEIRSTKIRLLIVYINIEKKTIYNKTIVGFDNLKGEALKILCSQIDYAVHYGYSNITLHALKKTQVLKDNSLFHWTGYNVWGKNGYQMLLSSEKRIFSNLMEEYDRNEEEIHELYYGTEEAEKSQELWRAEGFTWVGYFDTTPDSLSHRILHDRKKKYLLEDKFFNHTI